MENSTPESNRLD